MPIFISHSHQDSVFVDVLAKRLILSRHHVWVDRWEMRLGDSLTQRIQGAMTDASAILVVLSRHSVESEWCKRELGAGLVRELEEKRTMVMACVIDDCEIPLFLKDKVYADFYQDSDKAWALLDTSLAKLANPYQARIEEPEWHTDWGLVWDVIEGIPQIKWTFVQHGPALPFVILSECLIFAAEDNEDRYTKALSKNHDGLIHEIGRELLTEFDRKPMTGKLKTNEERFVAFELTTQIAGKLAIIYNYRRLGEDTGMDTVIYLDANLRLAIGHFQNVLRSA